MKWAQENPALAAGIGLPILLVFVFSLAALIPKWTVDPPQYDVLFTVDEYSGNMDSDVRVNVANGRLKAEYRKPPAQNYGNRPRLFLFDTQTMTTREITLQPPSESTPPPEPQAKSSTVQQSMNGIANADGSKLVVSNIPVGNPQAEAATNQWQEFPVQETASMTIDSSSKAPDGYEFRNSHSGGHMDFPFFYSSRSKYQPSIVKSGRAVSIPQFAGHYYSYYNVRFLGWVTPEAAR